MTPRTVLITGATGGFGAAMARRFAGLGYALILHARSPEKLDRLTESLPGVPLTKIIFDMRDTDALSAAISPLPAVDVLINNAGLALGIEPAQRADMDDWDEMIETNIRSLVRITRLVLPGMVARKQGYIVNIGSVAGSWPYAGGNVYGATKSFVRQFSLGLRADLHGTGVRVTNLEPGLAETNFSIARFKGDTDKAASVYAGTTPLTGEDIAEAVTWVTELPAHININTMEIMPVDQSFAGFNIHREKT